MSLAIITDLEPLVAPVEASAPAGADLRYQPIYDEIKAARRDAEADPRELPPWRRVTDLVTTAMTRSRDLQLAAWLAESLSWLEGYQGAAAGLTVVRRTLDQYWEPLYPRIDPEDNDPLEHRRALLEWLDERLPGVLKIAPLSGPPALYGVIHYEVTQKTGPEKQALVEEGWPTLERFQAALQSTAPARLEAVLTHVLACEAELSALQASVDQHFNQPTTGAASAPLRLVTLKQTFELARWLVERVVRKTTEADAAVQRSGGAGEPAPGPLDADQVWAEALTLTRDSKVDGLRLVQSHLSGATSGRDTFLRQLQLAELSLEAGVYSLAFPVFDELARTIDARKLEEWEDRALIVRVFQGVARCCGLLKTQNSASAARETEMLDRIAQLQGSSSTSASAT